MNEHLEHDIKQAVKQEIDTSPERKEAIWAGIEAEISSQPIRRKRKPFLLLYGSAAAAILLSATFGTEPGQAVVKSIKELFVAEKSVPISIEGENETTKTTLHDGTQQKQTKSDYVLYYDKERYELKKQGDRDVVVAKNYPANAPLVQLEIKQETKTPEQLQEKILSEVRKTYATVRVEEVTEPITSTKIYAQNGSEWNSPVKVIYLTSNQKNGTFIITEDYFVEASEGHGARMNAMLQTFKLVN